MTTVIRGSDNFDTSENGRVLQIVQAVSTTTVALGSSAGTFYDIISQVITPKSATSKLLIEFDALGQISSGNFPALKTQLLNGSTVISGPTRLEAYYGASTSNNSGWNRRIPLHTSLLYAHGVTSSITIKAQAANDRGSAEENNLNGQIKAGSSGKDITLTITEIEA